MAIFVSQTVVHNDRLYADMFPSFGGQAFSAVVGNYSWWMLMACLCLKAFAAALQPMLSQEGCGEQAMVVRYERSPGILTWCGAADDDKFFARIVKRAAAGFVLLLCSGGPVLWHFSVTCKGR